MDQAVWGLALSASEHRTRTPAIATCTCLPGLRQQARQPRGEAAKRGEMQARPLVPPTRGTRLRAGHFRRTSALCVSMSHRHADGLRSFGSTVLRLRPHQPLPSHARDLQQQQQRQQQQQQLQPRKQRRRQLSGCRPGTVGDAALDVHEAAFDPRARLAGSRRNALVYITAALASAGLAPGMGVEESKGCKEGKESKAGAGRLAMGGRHGLQSELQQ
eukprot:58000-Chlamydomonas_euryale.AAC.3